MAKLDTSKMKSLSSFNTTWEQLMDDAGPDGLQKHPPGSADATHNGADGHIQQTRRLGVTQTDDVDQGDDLPLMLRQFRHLELYGQDSDKTFVPSPKFHLRVKICLFLDRHGRLFTPDAVEKEVSQDPEQPRPIGRFVAGDVPGRKRPHCAFLDQVFGLVVITG